MTVWIAGGRTRASALDGSPPRHLKPLTDEELVDIARGTSNVTTFDVLHVLFEQAKEANALRTAVIDICSAMDARHVTNDKIWLLRKRANSTARMFHQNEPIRRFWNAEAGTGPSFSTVASDSTMALLIIAQYCDQNFGGEIEEISVKEVSAEDAKTKQIVGDDPCMLFDMPYGDVACSEY